jgi:hypothetical protein
VECGYYGIEGGRTQDFTEQDGVGAEKQEKEEDLSGLLSLSGRSTEKVRLSDLPDT